MRRRLPLERLVVRLATTKKGNDMACPKCGCKTTYQYDHMEDCMIVADERFERCAACGEVFDIEDHADEEDDEDTGALSSRPIGWGLVPDFEQVA